MSSPPPTYWIAGRLVDEHAPLRRDGGWRRSPWVQVIAVLGLLWIADFLVGQAPAREGDASPNPDTLREVLDTLERAHDAAEAGERSVLLIGDSVLAGDVMEGRFEGWQDERVVDHLRRQSATDAGVHFEQVALDGLLPVDALRILAELDRLDPEGRVEVVLELNLRYWSKAYAKQLACSRPLLCEVGGVAATHPLRDEPKPWATGLDMLADGSRKLREAVRRGVPVHRHAAQAPDFDLREVPGLAVAKQGARPGADANKRDEGLARVREHYRSAKIGTGNLQVRALEAMLDRFAAAGRRGHLFLTPLHDGFVADSLKRNGLGHVYEEAARRVHEHPAAAGQVGLLHLDHPLFGDPLFIDHVHLVPEGNRILALNLLHELGVPLRRRPHAVELVHDFDHDETYAHRRSVGYAPGGAWEAQLGKESEVSVSPGGDWVVIADRHNEILRHYRGSMQVLERLAGKPGKAGLDDGDALKVARLERPRSPRISGESVYFVDGIKKSVLRRYRKGQVDTLSWKGPKCRKLDRIDLPDEGGSRRLFMLCEDDRILELDLRRERTRVLHEPSKGETGPARGYTALAAAKEGPLYFADGQARIWSIAKRGKAPKLVFANAGAQFMPQAYGELYPFDFDEVSFQTIQEMDWVERHGGLLVQDEHSVQRERKRLVRQMTERVHLRFLDLERREVWPWTKATPHGDAHTMWNAKADKFISYFHQGSMAVAQADASLVWTERQRTRVFRIADGLVGNALQGNLNQARPSIQLRNALASESSAEAASRFGAPERLQARHEPRPMRGHLQALMINSSGAVLSDRIGNYSLGRRLELELGAELASRHRVRLDLVQRSARSPRMVDELEMLRRALAEGWTPELIVVELKDWEPHFFAGLEGEAEREAVFAAFRELAADRQLVFFDNSAIGQEGRDGLRASTPAMLRLIDQLRAAGFVVLEPSDQLLRELMRESPWGNQTYGPGQRHAAAWAIDATARVLASAIYPQLRTRLEGGGQP